MLGFSPLVKSPSVPPKQHSGLVAWFQASALAKVSTANATGSFVAKGSTLKVGTFKLTAVPALDAGDASGIELTTTAGKTYVDANGETDGGLMEVPVTNGVATYTAKIKVTYVPAASEPAKSASEIKTTWDQTIAAMTADNLVITVTPAMGDANPAGNGYTLADLRLLETDNKATLDANSGAKWEGVAGNAVSLSNNTINVSKTNLAAVTWDTGHVADALTEVDCTTATQAAGAAGVFLAITGKEAYLADNKAPQYKLTFAPAVPAGLTAA